MDFQENQLKDLLNMEKLHLLENKPLHMLRRENLEQVIKVQNMEIMEELEDKEMYLFL